MRDSSNRENSSVVMALTQIHLNAQEEALLNSINEAPDELVNTTRRLADINSGSFNIDGIEKVNEAFTELFRPLSDDVEKRKLSPITRIDSKGETDTIDTCDMLLFHARKEAPVQLLFTGHSDTVFPVDSSFSSTWIEGNHLRGPGVADMKGGLVVLARALQAIHHSPFKSQVGFTVAISPEEEIGSPVSAPELESLAKQADFGLTYEPALADGTLAGARKGSGNFTLVARGKSAHAGREFFIGRNAITALARLSLQLEALSNEEAGISVNIGNISGGGAVNVVPDFAMARFNVRIKENAQQAFIEQQIGELISQVERETQCQITLHGNFNRPPKPLNPRQEQMFALLKTCGEQLDIPIAFKATGGCCEGNNLAAAGLVNIDTLGVRGGHIHSDQEFACIDSFVERARLSALMIAKLSQQEKF